MFDTYEEVFARRADSYHRAMSRSPGARDAEFQAALAPFEAQPAGLLCDMPAGGGYLAKHLDASWSYMAVEPSVFFFDACPSGGRCSRVQASLSDVPTPSGSVDHVVSLAGLHHEPDVDAVFREMRRLTRPGGRVVVMDVACGTAPALFLNGYVDAHNPQGHDGIFLDGGTSAKLEDAGLIVVDDEMVSVPWMFSDEETAGDYCRDLFGLEGVDADEVVSALAREVGLDASKDGVRLRWTLRRIVCLAGA